MTDARRVLVRAARAGRTINYRDLAGRLGFGPPGAIRRVGRLLEELMVEDAEANRPFLSSIVVSRAGDLPRRGYFEQARVLGRYDGPAEGPEARRYFEREYQAAAAFWGGVR